MSTNPEDLTIEKEEFEYTHGFLDALNLVRSNANPILMYVPEAKRLDVLMAMIDWLNTEALERHSENTRVWMGDTWNLASYLQHEGIPREKFQSDEKHEAKPQSAAPTVNEEKIENEKQDESECAFESINVTFPKAFLQNVVGYMKKTGHYNDLDEFVLEALREKMLKVL
jgi:hypothetical protein